MNSLAFPETIDNRSDWVNWPLVILIALVPLQNIYLGKIPSLGAGINVLNVLMLFAFFGASRRRETRYANSMNKYILLLATSYVLSTLVASSVMGWDENNLYILKDMFFAYLFFFVTYKSITSERAIKAIFWATVIPLPYMFRVFYSNLSWMGFSSYKDKLRMNSGTFMELGSNEIAAFYATYTFVVLGYALTEKDNKKKLFLFIVIAMNIYSLIYSFSRGAYLAGMVGIAVFFWLNQRIKQFLLISSVILVLLVGGVEVFPKAVTERFNSSFVDDDELDDSALKRKILWAVAVDKFHGSPLIGVGFRNFKKMNEFGLDTHNYYVKLLAEGGILSFLTFVLFMIASVKLGFELLRKSCDALTHKLAIGFLACIFSVVVGNFFGDRFTHYPLISYLFVYLAIVLNRVEMLRADRSSELTSKG